MLPTPSCLGCGQGVPRGQWSHSLGELGTVPGQNKSLFLVCVAVASGLLLCQPWEAAEPMPSGVLDAAFCIAAVPEVGGGWLSAAAGAGAGWQKTAGHG